MNPRWTQLHRLLQEFQALLAPQVPQLGIHDGSVGNLTTWSPALKKPGVYLLFDAAPVLNTWVAPQANR
jgi:hypothetical protein